MFKRKKRMRLGFISFIVLIMFDVIICIINNKDFLYLVTPITTAAFATFTISESRKSEENTNKHIIENKKIESQRVQESLIYKLINSNNDLIKNNNEKLEKLCSEIKEITFSSNFILYLFEDKLRRCNAHLMLAKNMKNIIHHKDLVPNEMSYYIYNYVVHGTTDRIDIIAINYLYENQKPIFKSLKIDNKLKQKGVNKSPTSNDEKMLKLMEQNGLLNFLDYYYEETNLENPHCSLYELIYKKTDRVFKQEEYIQVDFFFRHIHRIMKLINKIEDEDIKKNYIGILRAQLSDNIILVIYFNCLFNEYGLGLAEELIETNFFGDETDYKENRFSIHANFSSLSDDPFLNRHQRILLNFFTKEEVTSKEEKRKKLREDLKQCFDKK